MNLCWIRLLTQQSYCCMALCHSYVTLCLLPPWRPKVPEHRWPWRRWQYRTLGTRMCSSRKLSHRKLCRTIFFVSMHNCWHMYFAHLDILTVVHAISPQLWDKRGTKSVNAGKSSYHFSFFRYTVCIICPVQTFSLTLHPLRVSTRSHRSSTLIMQVCFWWEAGDPLLYTALL